MYGLFIIYAHTSKYVDLWSLNYEEVSDAFSRWKIH